MLSANVFSHDVFGMAALPLLRIRTLYQYIVPHQCQDSVREPCVNTPVVGALVHPVRALGQHSRVAALSVLRIRTLCQHSESQHSQYSILKHYINNPVVEVLSVLRTRAMSQHSGCRRTLSTPY
jgi:hypothetical protein